MTERIRTNWRVQGPLLAFLLLSVVPFSPASHVGQKMEARGLVYNDADSSRLTLTSLKPTGASCQ